MTLRAELRSNIAPQENCSQLCSPPEAKSISDSSVEKHYNLGVLKCPANDGGRYTTGVVDAFDRQESRKAGLESASRAPVKDMRLCHGIGTSYNRPIKFLGSIYRSAR